MFAFILGTSPVFFLLGYTTRRLAGTLQRRFMQFAGAMIIVLAVLTLNAALNLLDQPYSLSVFEGPVQLARSPPSRPSRPRMEFRWFVFTRVSTATSRRA